MLDFLTGLLPIATGILGSAAGVFGGKKVAPVAIIGVLRQLILLSRKKRSRGAAEALGVKHGMKVSAFMRRAIGKGIWESSEDELMAHAHHYMIGVRKGANLDD